ncbi:gelsolin isoform X2 [Eurytemora carolleeae]|uniref:gelsolin isoform X2 n=1 Tax=Eurytemora carolleeae TaxID=1294199 RepID=UPI000C78746E|nr:gelsolin isoform X2 [Eurytemora carolleeae]|eukprot:XP_023342244.1 gelsolin-like isoform X2 [Eurytemora affinis]
MLAILLFVTFLGMSAGEECNELQDPIKRDQGLGPFNVSRVERSESGIEGKLVPISEASHPFKNAFYEGDSYVVNYAVREGRPGDVVYYWQGAKSNVWEKGASAILAVQLDTSIGGGAIQSRVEMGKEPLHFISMFGGTFVTLQGGVEKNEAETDTDGTMLFKVTSQCNKAGFGTPITRTQQVDENKASLNDEDVFILKTPTSLFIFQAEGASDEEIAIAPKVAENLFPGEKASIFQGSPPPAIFTVY